MTAYEEDEQKKKKKVVLTKGPGPKPSWEVEPREL